jgi:hypothetical protein
MMDINNPEIVAQFEQEGRNHIAFLEEWSVSQPAEVAGVNILQALTYDLVQLLNNAFLRDFLVGQGGAQ